METAWKFLKDFKLEYFSKRASMIRAVFIGIFRTNTNFATRQDQAYITDSSLPPLPNKPTIHLSLQLHASSLILASHSISSAIVLRNLTERSCNAKHEFYCTLLCLICIKWKFFMFYHSPKNVSFRPPTNPSLSGSQFSIHL